jgi:hypothetical protein
MNTRLLGTLGMLGSPMLLVEGLLYRFQQRDTDQLIAVLGLLFVGGWICSVLGLRTLKATGTGVLGKAVLVVQLIGLALAGLWAIIHIVNPNPDTGNILYAVADAAWPLSVIFMIVVGIATLIAKRLPGWQRLTPLLCGLALPVAILAGMVAGEQAGAVAFGIYTAVAWMLLGYAVRTSKRTATSEYALSAS